MKIKILALLFCCLFAAGFLFYYHTPQATKTPEILGEEFHAARKTVQTTITANGIIEPKTRLEVTPPIIGRIEKILIHEGETVQKGRPIAWVSSTERTAMIDAAAAQGPEEVRYWENMYKPTPIISPIDGKIIVQSIKEGQSVSTTSIIAVISDKLILQAYVDETDIRRVKIGQTAVIALDAYPSQTTFGKVDHIAYESIINNNVTMYKVTILPDTIPEVFRSGMNANITIFEQQKDNVLTLPLSCLQYSQNGYFVFLKTPDNQLRQQAVKIGIKDTEKVEILDGITEKDTVILMPSAKEQ